MSGFSQNLTEPVTRSTGHVHAAREVDEAYGVSENHLVHLVHLVHSCQYLAEMALGRKDRTLSAARR